MHNWRVYRDLMRGDEMRPSLRFGSAPQRAIVVGAATTLGAVALLLLGWSTGPGLLVFVVGSAIVGIVAALWPRPVRSPAEIRRRVRGALPWIYLGSLAIVVAAAGVCVYLVGHEPAAAVVVIPVTIYVGWRVWRIWPLARPMIWRKPRELLPNERELLKLLLGQASFQGAQELAAQVESTKVVGGVPTMLDLIVPRTAGPSAAGDGPIPLRGFVGPSEGEAEGEVLVWVRDGYLSGLEYSRYTDDPPAEMPTPDRVRVD